SVQRLLLELRAVPIPSLLHCLFRFHLPTTGQEFILLTGCPGRRGRFRDLVEEEGEAQRKDAKLAKDTKNAWSVLA
ncbi:MAG: hypothetical protein WC012_14040, partial [Thiohalomonadaceae bacterium]